MAKLTLNDIQGQYASTSELNDNFTLIETALQNTLSRDGTAPNTMSADFDMNSNNINNVQTVNTTNLILNGASVTASDLSAVTASQVTNVPAGGIVATDVQAAINELDAQTYTQAEVDALIAQAVIDAENNALALAVALG